MIGLLQLFAFPCLVVFQNYHFSISEHQTLGPEKIFLKPGHRGDPEGRLQPELGLPVAERTKAL